MSYTMTLLYTILLSLLAYHYHKIVVPTCGRLKGYFGQCIAIDMLLTSMLASKVSELFISVMIVDS